MDCIGLQALSDSSESDIEESFVRIEHDPNSHENMQLESDREQAVAAVSKAAEPSTQEKREFLYGQYKDGLKTLMTGDYLGAEKSFEDLLAHSYLDQFAADKYEGDSELSDSDKALIQLKYILYKNLASISTKHTQDLSKALNFLIQAAKIDASDICLWFEIGQTSLQLDRFLIAKLAFEQSLRLDPAYWPSLDNFIVLVYALGNHTLCLRYVFSALKLDKFYMNGIILLKKMALSEDAMHTQQIELFVDANYDSCGIDLDSLLANSPDTLYDQLFDRIDGIADKLYLKRMERAGTAASEARRPAPMVFDGKEVGTWKALGERLVDLNGVWWASQWNAQTPVDVKVELEPEPELAVAAGHTDTERGPAADATLPHVADDDEAKKLDEVKAIVATSGSARSLKRKKTDAQSSSDDSWWKRRSSRKGNDKSCEAEAELTVQHILKKFFDEAQLSEARDTAVGNGNSAEGGGGGGAESSKKALNESLMEHSVPELKDSEAQAVRKLLVGFGASQSVHRVCRAYLERLAENFGRIWPAGLDETYLRLFGIVNGQYDLWEAIESEGEPSELLRLASLLLVYLELEFSKFKDTVERFSQKRQLSVASIERINGKHIVRLVNQLQRLETCLEAAGLLHRNDPLCLPSRLAALALYAGLNTSPGTLSTAYYVDQLERLLANEGCVLVANSRVLAVLSRQTVLDLVKLYNKSQILMQADRIRDMFDAHKFQEVLDLVEEFAQNHRLSLKDAKFDPSIYVHFLRSCLGLDQVDKCAHFCLKFLRQIVRHFRAQLSNKSREAEQQAATKASGVVCAASSVHSLDTNDASTNLSNASSEASVAARSSSVPQVMRLLGTVLDTLLEVFRAKRKASESGDSQPSASSGSQPAFAGSQDLVWLMHQLLLMFFENHYANLKYFQASYRPLKAFCILFECMAASGSPKSERVQFLSLVHQYLAKSSLCMDNSGEFLLWSTELLMAYVQKCQICNQPEADQEPKDKAIDIAAEQTTENSNNETESSSQVEDSSQNSKQQQQQQQKKKKAKVAAADEPGCDTCDDCSDLVEQNLACLYGYRKPRARYLETHAVARHLDYTLENCVHVYEHFRLAELPEYDDVAKWSISAEFNEFLLLVVRLLGVRDEALVELQERFWQGLETERHEEVAGLVRGLRGSDLRHEQLAERFGDLFYMLGDHALKTEKDFERKKSLVLTFLSMDIALNSERYDSWAALALLQSSIVLEGYLEAGFNLTAADQVEAFLRQVYVTVNLFRCSTELLPKDQKIWVEYGSFLYQIHSYCSRQLKLDLMVKHFSEADMRPRLEAKRVEFLGLALEAYTTVNSGRKTEASESEADTAAEESTNSQQTVATVQSQSSGAPSKSAALSRRSDKEANGPGQADEDNTEKWLFHYMLGKIREKMGSHMACLMQSLEHYRAAIRYLETVNRATFLKKMTHKTKGNFSFEANEIYYRIYCLTLKRLEKLSGEASAVEMECLVALLEEVAESKFVKCHGDWQLDEVSLFVSELMTRQRSRAMAGVAHSDAFFRVLCLCVAGLMQLLKRYPQHYRSQHRLARFYAGFLDLECADMAKHVLLGTPNWAQLPYMSAPGLLHDKSKASFFGGVHPIGDQDLERGGSYENHMFQVVKLLIELLQKTSDLGNLLELSRGLYAKSDTERQYLEDSQRIYCANLSLETARTMFLSKQLSTIRRHGTGHHAPDDPEMTPIALDAYELHKLYAKLDKSHKVDDILTEIYLRFHPDRRHVMTNEEMMRFYRTVEAKDKAEKATSRNKPAKLARQHSQSQPIVLN